MLDSPHGLLILTLLSYQAVDQLWCLLCLLICLPIHSHWLWHGQGCRSFEAKSCAWLCATQDRPHQTQIVHQIFFKSVRMMALLMFGSLQETSYISVCAWLQRFCKHHHFHFSPSTLLDSQLPLRQAPCDWAISADHVMWLAATFDRHLWMAVYAKVFRVSEEGMKSSGHFFQSPFCLSSVCTCAGLIVPPGQSTAASDPDHLIYFNSTPRPTISLCTLCQI